MLEVERTLPTKFLSLTLHMIPKANQFVYTLPNMSGRIALLVIIGIPMILMGLFSFVVAVFFGNAGALQLHFSTTLPVMLGCFALSQAWRYSRSPDTIVLDDEGVVSKKNESITLLKWDQIAWVMVQGQPSLTGASKCIDVYDRSGKRILRVSDTIREFDDFVERVKKRVADRKDDAHLIVRMKKARRKSWAMISISILLITITTFLIWDSVSMAHDRQSLEEIGIEGEAEIVERLLAPNGRTTRLIIKVTNQQNESAERNCEVDPLTWALLANRKTVPIRFIPDKPSVNRLIHGEVEEREKILEPPFVYLLAGLLFLLAAFLLGYGILCWKGLEIDFDSKKRKFSIKKYGEGA